MDDNVSVWAARAPPRAPRPPLEGDERADVVVVGAGFTGLSTAWHLSARHPERRIVVVEARSPGAGASGRNSGMALHWFAGPPSDPGAARRHYALTTETIAWMREVAARAGVGVREGGTLEVSTDAARAEAAHAEAELLASYGLPIRWLAGAELRAKVDAVGVVGAVFDPTTAVIDGHALARALADEACARGVAVYEGSPVVRVEPGPEHVVRTAGGSVRAPTLVLATNGYTPGLGWFGGGVFPLHSHVVATEALPPERWRALGWGDAAGFSDDLDRIAYASLAPDGRLVFGGGGNPAYDYYFGGATTPPAPPERGWAFVRSVMLRYFPALADVRVEHRWSGVLGITLSRVCSVGVAGRHRNVLYGLGYSGHGVVLANLAGRVLADLYAGHREPWEGLPFLDRPLRGIPPEPLRKLGYEAYTRLTGRSPRR